MVSLSSPRVSHQLYRPASGDEDVLQWLPLRLQLGLGSSCIHRLLPVQFLQQGLTTLLHHELAPQNHVSCPGLVLGDYSSLASPKHPQFTLPQEVLKEVLCKSTVVHT